MACFDEKIRRFALQIDDGAAFSPPRRLLGHAV
jgi:hypothetical protein